MANMSHSVPRLTGLARLAWVLLALAALVPAARAAPIDSGKFRIYLRGRSMGYENFFIDQYADSVVMESLVRQLIITPDGDDSLMKTARLFVSAFDLDLRHYESTYTLGRARVTRGLILADTSLTSYREVNGYGTAPHLLKRWFTGADMTGVVALLSSFASVWLLPALLLDPPRRGLICSAELRILLLLGDVALGAGTGGAHGCHLQHSSVTQMLRLSSRDQFVTNGRDPRLRLQSKKRAPS